MKKIIETLKQSSLVSKLVFGIASLGLVGLIGFGTVAAQSNSAVVTGTGYGGNAGFTKTVDNKNHTITIVKPPNGSPDGNGATVTKTNKP